MSANYLAQGQFLDLLRGIVSSYQFNLFLNYAVYAELLMILAVDIFVRPQQLKKYSRLKKWQMMIPGSVGRRAILEDDVPSLRPYRLISCSTFVFAVILILLNVAEYILISA